MKKMITRMPRPGKTNIYCKNYTIVFSPFNCTCLRQIIHILLAFVGINLWPFGYDSTTWADASRKTTPVPNLQPNTEGSSRREEAFSRGAQTTNRAEKHGENEEQKKVWLTRRKNLSKIDQKRKSLRRRENSPSETRDIGKDPGKSKKGTMDNEEDEGEWEPRSNQDRQSKKQSTANDRQ